MRLHESSDPAVVFCPEELDRPVLCPGCETEFLIRTGVSYHTIAKMKERDDDTGEWRWVRQRANVPFCSHRCYLTCVYVEGRG